MFLLLPHAVGEMSRNETEGVLGECGRPSSCRGSVAVSCECGSGVDTCCVRWSRSRCSFRWSHRLLFATGWRCLPLWSSSFRSHLPATTRAIGALTLLHRSGPTSQPSGQERSRSRVRWRGAGRLRSTMVAAFGRPTRTLRVSQRLSDNPLRAVLRSARAESTAVETPSTCRFALGRPTRTLSC